MHLLALHVTLYQKNLKFCIESNTTTAYSLKLYLYICLDCNECFVTISCIYLCLLKSKPISEHIILPDPQLSYPTKNLAKHQFLIFIELLSISLMIIMEVMMVRNIYCHVFCGWNLFYLKSLA